MLGDRDEFALDRSLVQHCSRLFSYYFQIYKNRRKSKFEKYAEMSWAVNIVIQAFELRVIQSTNTRVNSKIQIFNALNAIKHPINNL